MVSNLYLGGALDSQALAARQRIEDGVTELRREVVSVIAPEIRARAYLLDWEEALEMGSARNEKQAEAEEKGPTAAETRAHREHIQELREKYGDWGNDYGDNEPSEVHDVEGDE